MNNNNKLIKAIGVAFIVTMAIGSLSILILVLKYLFGG